MNLILCVISSVWLLLCMIGCSCSEITVKGFYGRNVTLPCKYDWKYHGICEICWMRGDIPTSGCGIELIATNGNKVERRSSTRYMLNGNIQKGNVSLTILNATQNDSGKYGCRVHVPGLFNDKKNVLYLVLTQEPGTTAATPSLSSMPVIITKRPWLSVSTEQVNTADLINSSLPMYNTKKDEETYNMLPGIVVSVLLLVLLGLFAVCLMWRQKRKSRMDLETAQNSHSTVIYGNLNSSMRLLNRDTAVENVYQLDTENEYEQWS